MHLIDFCAARNSWLLAEIRAMLQPAVMGSKRMSRDVIKSYWPRLQGRLRAKFSKLTHDDVSHGEGDRAYLVGRLKERYGITLDAAQLKVAQFERLLN